MKLNNSILWLMVFGLIVSVSCKNGLTGHKKAPVAKIIEKELTIHGQKRIDPYYWLNDRNNPEVINYLTAENEYTNAVMKHTIPLQDSLYSEMVSRIKQADETVPYFENGYYYFTRFLEGKEYPVYCRKKNLADTNVQILLDVNKMAEKHSYYDVSGISVSHDAKFMAFGVDTVSRRKYTIYFKNLETNELQSDKIPVTTGDVVWATDNRTLYYVTIDNNTLRSHKIFRHYLGSDITTDKELFYEDDETFSVNISQSKSKEYIFINHISTLSTEVRYLHSSDITSSFKVMQPRETNLEYSVEHANGKFYILTNKNGKNFHIMISDSATVKDKWRDFIMHNDKILVQNFEVFEQFLVSEERSEGLTRLRIVDLATQATHFLDFGEENYTTWIDANPMLNTNQLRFGYSSLTTPNSVIDYNLNTRQKTVLKEQEILGDFNKNNYETKRLFATGKDGVKIPVTLVYRKGIKLDGNNPCLQYAYGSYGYSTEAYFRYSILSLLDRGFVYAIAHVRGGQEMGRAWYEDGKLLKKKNTFTDFAMVSQFLIDSKYTSSDKLFAMGGSAGGLLMGVIANEYPELYKGIIAAVPFVDVVTTMLDETIPLTTGEYDEWGNPNDKIYYDYMLSYSPFDNVKAHNYPAMLVTTGLHDSQVQYWEPAKWVAKLRTVKTDNNLLLLQTNMEAGHGGASGRFERLKEVAFEYAFMFNLLGITK